jgi:hypothetical protein
MSLRPAIPDLSRHRLIHGAMRVADDQLVAGIAGSERGDRRRAAAVWRWFDGYAADLRVHHRVDEERWVTRLRAPWPFGRNFSSVRVTRLGVRHVRRGMELCDGATAPLGDGRPSGRSLGVRLGRITRNWWPVGAFLMPVLVLQTVWSARYDVAGHAAGHLGSAMVVCPMIFVSSVLMWAMPAPARRDPVLWLIIAVVIGCCLVATAGNLRVVDAIGDDTWTDAQAGALGPTRPGFEAGHDLASRGAVGAVLATIVAAGLLWRRRLVSAKVAAGAAVLSVIFPYWIVPGAGIVVLALSAAVQRHRRLRDVRDGQPSTRTGLPSAAM